MGMYYMQGTIFGGFFWGFIGVKIESVGMKKILGFKIPETFFVHFSSVVTNSAQLIILCVIQQKSGVEV
jgi:hypothetical protein